MDAGPRAGDSAPTYRVTGISPHKLTDNAALHRAGLEMFCVSARVSPKPRLYFSHQTPRLTVLGVSARQLQRLGWTFFGLRF